MKLNKLLFLVPIVASLLLWQACKDNELDQRDNFDRTAMLTNISTAVILPAHEALVTQAEVLTQATTAFTASPTQTTLDALQGEWLETKLAFKRCELFDLGPIMDAGLHVNMDRWETNTAFIENFIATVDTISETFINERGATSKGLPAIEYLIFTDDAEVLAAFTTGPRAAERKLYLNALAENFEAKATEMLNIWSASGQHYAQDFIEGSGDGLEGSINMLANEMIGSLEKLMRRNLGNALGTESGQAPNADLLEAPYAKTSLPLLRENFVSLQNTFNGGTSASDIGFADYLDYLSVEYEGAPLSDKINSQFDLVLEKIDAIPQGLEVAVENNTAQVQDLYDTIRELLVLIKVDMANNLAVTITFSDNDGD